MIALFPCAEGTSELKVMPCYGTQDIIFSTDERHTPGHSVTLDIDDVNELIEMLEQFKKQIKERNE